SASSARSSLQAAAVVYTKVPSLSGFEPTDSKDNNNGVSDSPRAQAMPTSSVSIRWGTILALPYFTSTSPVVLYTMPQADRVAATPPMVAIRRKERTIVNLQILLFSVCWLAAKSHFVEPSLASSH